MNTINSVDIATYDLLILKVPPIIRPQRRVRNISVPGRSGVLREWSGDYEAYTKKPEFLYKGESLGDAMDFLRNATLISFENEPDYCYEVSADEVVESERGKAGEMYIKCAYLTQPLKRLVNEPILDEETTYTVTNIGNEPALPKIIVTGAGTKTLSIGSDEITIAFAIGGETITIDSLNGQIYDANGASAWNKVTGNLPTIPVSESSITISTTGTALTVYPNWRWT